MRKIIKKKDRLVHATPLGKTGKLPVIYIRYYQNVVMYIGETSDMQGNRPFRVEKNNLYDKVRLLNASANTDLRRKWEAKLIVRLKPKTQRLNPYLKRAQLDYKCSTDSNFIKGKNTVKIFEYLCGRYDTVCNMYDRIIKHRDDIQKLFLKEQVKDVFKGEEKFKYNLALTFEKVSDQQIKIDYLNLGSPDITHFIKKCSDLYKTCTLIDGVPKEALRSRTTKFYKHIELNVLEMYKIVKFLVQLRPKAYVVEGEIISLKDFKKNGEISLFNKQIFNTKYTDPMIGIITKQELYKIKLPRSLNEQ